MRIGTRIVLAFAALRRPLDPHGISDVRLIRKGAEAAARMGFILFDKKVRYRKWKDIDIAPIRVRHYADFQHPQGLSILYFHGGGFVSYGLDSHDNICRRLSVMNRCSVVSVDYRRAPEFTFPTAHDDAWHAFLWLRDHAESMGIHPDRIVVAGDSAGGNLATCVAIRAKKKNIPLKAQILAYPWIDGRVANPSIRRLGKGYLLTHDSILWFQKQYTPKIEDQCKPEVSPCFESDLSGLPPAMILTASLDPLVDEGNLYAQQLAEAGNRVVSKEYSGLLHGFLNIPGADPLAYQAFEDIRLFLNYECGT